MHCVGVLTLHVQVSLVPSSRLERGIAVKGFHLDRDRPEDDERLRHCKSTLPKPPTGGQGSAASGSRESLPRGILQEGTTWKKTRRIVIAGGG